eukprot:Transcript_18178.p1 GENE.Transcript_18178~~Transcript_18178.p1  ORF type:complete len:635 (+),score=309.96 Transcript_18178:44-1906(+)
MPRRTGRLRQSGHSHSIKKVLRRNGADVSCKKSKRKKHVHPGKEKKGKNTPAQRRAAREAKRNPDPDAMDVDGKKKEPEATAARREARQSLGKQLRAEELAKRRGLAMQMGGGGLDDDAPAPGADGDSDATGGAHTVAGHALASAPPAQKAFQRELSKVLQASDILVEVLDARDPLGCRCKPLEDAVMQNWQSKRVVLLLNKCDLVPPEMVSKWVTYLRQFFPTLPFKASTQTQTHGLSSQRGGAHGGKAGAGAYGADSLLQLLKNYSRSFNLKTAITVGIVGYPNVGKSSVINSLKRARAVDVGATPGLTTHAQTVTLDKKVKLMDCPGIVFAKARNAEEEADVLLRNCLRVEQMSDPAVPVAAILRRVPAAQLRAQYGIAEFGDDVTSFLTLVALKRGALRKGGAADQAAAARAVLQDWNAGHIKYHTPPPREASEVTLVSSLAQEFDRAQAPRVEPASATPKPFAFESAPAAPAAGGGGAVLARPDAAGQAAAAAGGGFGGGFGGGGGGAGASRMQVQGDEEAESEEGGEEQAGGGKGGKGDGLLGAARRQQQQKQGQKLTRKAMLKAKIAQRQDLSDEADRFNPQANKAIHKQQKAVKRKQRRNDMSRLLAATAVG